MTTATSLPTPLSLRRSEDTRPSLLAGPIWLLGWLWRWAAGAILCLNYVGSIVVVGWSYRWMRGRVLRGWWQQSQHANAGTFDDFLASMGEQAPARRPRWLLHENIRSYLDRPDPTGQAPSTLRWLGRWLVVPWHSLWLNFSLGFQGLLCTYLLTGPGCFLMTTAWFFGWENSFHKGYEQATLGILTSLGGIFLFVVAMVYVPLAQVHHAVTGEARAFFDFAFLLRLVRARLGSLCWLAFLVLLISLPLEILKTAPLHFVEGMEGPQLIGNRRDLTPAQMLADLQHYLFICCLLLFLLLLLVRGLTCRIYRSAVLKVLADGSQPRRDLHPVLVDWLGRLNLLPRPAPQPVDDAPLSVVKVVRGVVLRGLPALWFWGWHRLLLGTLLFLWFLFVFKTYVGEFFNYHPFWGYMNHVLIQFPCFDFVPHDLREAAARGSW